MENSDQLKSMRYVFEEEAISYFELKKKFRFCFKKGSPEVMVNLPLVKYGVTIGIFHLPIVERNPINNRLGFFQNQAQFPLIIMRTGTSDK